MTLNVKARTLGELRSTFHKPTSRMRDKKKHKLLSRKSLRPRDFEAIVGDSSSS